MVFIRYTYRKTPLDSTLGKLASVTPLKSALTDEHRVLPCLDRNHPLASPLSPRPPKILFASSLESSLTRKGGTLPLLARSPVRFYAGRGLTSAASTSTATERWISSSETTTRIPLFFRFSTPSSPAKGPQFIRTRRPTIKNGCGSARSP